ncbi:hypothetical protein JR316_0013542 [Psilocybe cubensis]|uniref:DUF6534 domain-containing protein n=2 Tax=Psilocybe cubensis TaxID=181762 RepID=A0A8H7XKW2_PSICU|nr:uncharacterized protein JR316_0013542 [Psilocybe cubensis]KAH9474161.1 hypothetical protein JR316_0013542 [Psilocybe cubensis]
MLERAFFTLRCYLSHRANGIEAMNMTGPLYATLISIFVADSTIAATLCVLLWQKKSQIKRTRCIVKSLTFYAVATGILTVLINLTTLLLKIFMNGTPAYEGPLFFLSNVYACSLLTSLDRRERMLTEICPSKGHISISLNSKDHSSSKIEISPYTKCDRDGDCCQPSTENIQAQCALNGDCGKDHTDYGDVQIKVETQTFRSTPDHESASK